MLSKNPSIETLQALQNAIIPHRCDMPEPIHYFSPGVYLRELTVPAGMLVVGKIHKHDHIMIVMSGCAHISTPHGNHIVRGGEIHESKAGAKRAVYAVEDTRFLTIHHNPENVDDLFEIEAEHIEPEDWTPALHMDARRRLDQ